MEAEKAEQLRLPLMVFNNQSKFGTNFTVSIEAAEGVTTGISAYDRAKTILTAVHREAKPSDVVQPGHIFPIIAQRGGVLTRAGHTEASCDLARLAGFQPCGVLVEIMNKDGSMARRTELIAFAKEKGLKIGTIADLIQYRLHQESTVELILERPYPTQYGDFKLVSFRDKITDQLHLALVYGTPDKQRPAAVRVHIQDRISDLPALQNTMHWPLEAAMAEIVKVGQGTLILLVKGQKEEPEVTLDRLKHLGEKGNPLPDAHWRSIGTGSQMIAQLGFEKLIVLDGEAKIHALSGFGLEIVKYIPYEENLNAYD
jgi:3,4-dihydroxy 2-butanone 4-phosphate synthase/GTP cyclohydrolase II